HKNGRVLLSEPDKHMCGRIIDEDEVGHDDIVETEEMVVGKSNEDMTEENVAE
ncbi:hypothetical protein HAX54_044059, partial [Datura stramonium]|nr:hypothetical protein [Datura stramonium]